MKKIVLNTEPSEITVDQLDHNKSLGVIVYKRESHSKTSTFALLAKVNHRDGNYGFVDMGGSSTCPTFVGRHPSNAIEKVLKTSRSVYQFDNMHQFVTWAYRRGYTV